MIPVEPPDYQVVPLQKNHLSHHGRNRNHSTPQYYLRQHHQSTEKFFFQNPFVDWSKLNHLCMQLPSWHRVMTGVDAASIAWSETMLVRSRVCPSTQPSVRTPPVVR